MELLEDIEWSRVLSTDGRIGRRAFWKLAGVPLLVVVVATWWGLLNAPDGGEAYDTFFFGVFAFSAIAAFFGVRRLHDMDRSGRWALVLVVPFLMAFIPVLSNIVLLIPLIVPVMIGVFSIGRGTRGPNEYGPPGNGSPFASDRRRT